MKTKTRTWYVRVETNDKANRIMDHREIVYILPGTKSKAIREALSCAVTDLGVPRRFLRAIVLDR
jgi:hypothetical protein